MDEIIAASASNKLIKGAGHLNCTIHSGFPIDLTRLIAAENKLSVDEAGFEEELNKQKKGRAATAMDTGDWTVLTDSQAFQFVGYDSLETRTKILRYRKVKGKEKNYTNWCWIKRHFMPKAADRLETLVFWNFQASLYASSIPKKKMTCSFHIAESIPDDLTGEWTARVDADRRRMITVHHSVTHLHAAALHQVLGTHVAQKGSLVNEEHLRFDFSHFAKMTAEEITAVERS